MINAADIILARHKVFPQCYLNQRRRGVLTQKKISEILLSFKSRSLRESIRHFIYKSGNISSIAVSGIAGLFLLWGVLTKIIYGDNIGIKVAICSGLALFITLKIRNIAFN